MKATNSLNRLGIRVWVAVLMFFNRDEKGATAVEYGIMVALIAAVIIATVKVLGSQVKSAFCTVVSNLGGTCPS